MVAMAQAYQQEIPEEYGYKVEIGQEVPDFDLVSGDGEVIPIKELRGKVVMLQFTASWCSVCRLEMPHIQQQIWKKWKDHPEFELYGVDLQEDDEMIEKFRSDMNITYPLAKDPEGEIFSDFTVPNAGVTRNIIVDRNGKIAYMTRLFKQNEFNEMVKVIGELINE